MGKSTISMVIFHSYVSLPEGNCWEIIQGFRHEPASLAAAASPEDFPPKVAVLGAFKKKKILGVKKRQKCEVKKDYRVFEHQTYPNTIFW